MTLSLCLLVMTLMGIILANSLDPDPEARQNVGPDLSQTVWHDTLMLSLKVFKKCEFRRKMKQSKLEKFRTQLGLFLVTHYYN